jgi:hypothetical protein
MQAMSRHPALAAAAAFLAVCLAGGGQAADSPRQRKKMNMDQPMSTGMMKPGMTKGEVRKAAEEKARKLEPLMEREEKAMPRERPAPR